MKLLRTPAVLAAVLAAAVVLAACGSSTSSSSASAASTTGSVSARRAKLAACLKQHGVTLPARPAGAGGPGGQSGAGGGYGGAPPQGGSILPGTGRQGRGFFGAGGARANPKFRAAFQACGGAFRGRPGGALGQTAIKRFVACVNQHGYKLPQPNFSGSGPVFPAGIQSNKKFQAASRACRSLLAPRATATPAAQT
jgi:hypothetical protein